MSNAPLRPIKERKTIANKNSIVILKEGMTTSSSAPWRRLQLGENTIIEKGLAVAAKVQQIGKRKTRVREKYEKEKRCLLNLSRK